MNCLEEHEHEADGEEIVDRDGNNSASRFSFTKLGKDQDKEKDMEGKRNIQILTAEKR